MEFQRSGSKFLSFSNANFLELPGAILSEILAASMRNVPLPHIGSRSGIPGSQPERKSRPQAKFSLIGAIFVFSLKPRLKRASPLVSMNIMTWFSSRNPLILISGVCGSTFGLRPSVFRNLSQIASFILSAAKLRLLSGQFVATTSTLKLCFTENHSFHSIEKAVSYMSCSVL